jgi:hypothetical protein
MEVAAALRDTLAWTIVALPQLQRFRACLAVCANYIFICRAETGARCHTGDLIVDNGVWCKPAHTVHVVNNFNFISIVDRPSHRICLFVRKSKGDQRRDSCDKLVFAIPIAANPILADLMDYYTQHRAAFCANFYKRPPPDALWSFSPAEPSADWGAASTSYAWLALALLTVNTSAPTGFKWTSYNLRKGDASAASCIGAPLPVIKCMGGWAKNSSVTEGKYIDPTATPTPVAWRFTPSHPQY